MINHVEEIGDLPPRTPPPSRISYLIFPIRKKLCYFTVSKMKIICWRFHHPVSISCSPFRFEALWSLTKVLLKNSWTNCKSISNLKILRYTMNSIWCMHKCPFTVSQLFDQFQNLPSKVKQKTLQLSPQALALFPPWRFLNPPSPTQHPPTGGVQVTIKPLKWGQSM